MQDNFSKFGRSGCKFYLDEDQIILRKISSGTQYNDRLRSQYQKQCKFKDVYNFSTPTPYEFSASEDLHYFDMRYVYGKTFNSFCSDSNVDQVLNFIDSLESFLEHSMNQSVLTDINFEKLQQKIKTISSLLGKQFDTYVKFLLNKPIEKLLIGRNHGDLTMSNIIFADRYYLIDFLDNPYETPLNDLVKVKQDSEHRFYLNLIERVDNKSKLCLNFIDTKLNSKFFNEVQSHEFLWLSVFNLLRVLPYLKNQQEIDSITRSLKKYEHRIAGSREI